MQELLLLCGAWYKEAYGQIVARQVFLCSFKASFPDCTRGRSSLRAAAAPFAAGFAASALQGMPRRRSPLWTEISPFKPKEKPIEPAQPLVTAVLHA